MKEKAKISDAVVKRLPVYRRYLEDLIKDDVERISSNELSSLIGFTASQIRQDLNNFGGFGQQGYGYNIRNLHDEIAKILNIDEEHEMIIVGAGHLGQALANYTNFRKRGFIVRAIFDQDPTVIGTRVGDVEVLPMEKIDEVVKSSNVKMAAVCIPKTPAVKVVEQLIADGVVGIWNFAHVDLEVPDNVVIENVHLSESLMPLSYRMGETYGRKEAEKEA